LVVVSQQQPFPVSCCSLIRHPVKPCCACDCAPELPALQICLSSCCCSQVAGSGGPAASQTFEQFIGFGDSTNDSGWYRNAAPNSTNPVYNTDFAIAVTQGGGEATTNPGLVVSQYLAAKFGLAAIPADQPGGTNYSTGDARNAQFNTVASGGLLGAMPTAVQMQNYLAANNGVANGNALYLISSGGNDITYAANNIAGALAQNAYVTTAANALVGGIVNLAAAGARYIIVPNTPSSFGTVPEPTLRATYKSVLWNGLAAAHVNFIPADVNAIYRAVTSNFSEFGLVAGAGPACTQPAGIPSGWSVMCSPTSTISTLVAPNAEFTHLFADDQHLSTAGQMILGDYEYSLVVAPIEISMLAEAPVKTRRGDRLDLQSNRDIRTGPQRRHVQYLGEWRCVGAIHELRLSGISQRSRSSVVGHGRSRLCACRRVARRRRDVGRHDAAKFQSRRQL
jgi:outer membrane lipase/esterase